MTQSPEQSRPRHPWERIANQKRPDYRTFGFEAEFATGGSTLARELSRSGLWEGDSMHGWHCDCDTCDMSVLKVQSDSTADVEVISQVFEISNRHNPDLGAGLTETLTILQQSAVKADARPGLGQGLHVHVSRPLSGWRSVCYAAFTIVEPQLRLLSRGRFRDQRDFNSPVTRWFDTTDDLISSMANMSNLYDDHRGAERYSNLCLDTRFQTWEFRLWNSTRSAWRIELAIRASLALSDPDFCVEVLENQTEGLDRGIEDLFEVYDGGGRLSELVNRQMAYLSKVGGGTPPLTAARAEDVYGAQSLSAQ